MVIRSGYPPPAGARWGQGADARMLKRRRVTGKAATESARARRETARRKRTMELGRVVVHLGADGGAALGAHVVVLRARREHQEELLARPGCAAAARAEEAPCLASPETFPGPGPRAASPPML